MIEGFIEAINAGQIFAVDWQSITEMLGEDMKRTHVCTIYRNDGAFPPKQEICSRQLTEEHICEILQRANIRFMAETYKDSEPYLPIETRFFSSMKTKSAPWIEKAIV